MAWAAQTCVHFMKILSVYTLNSHLLTLKVHNPKMYFLSSTKICEASKTNSADPDLILVHNVCLYAYVK